MGCLYEVYNELGYDFQEKIYERAICKNLTINKINYKNQVSYTISFKGEIVGKYYLDFLIENKIVLEIKKGNYYSRKNIDQVKGYLKTIEMKLAILANFTSNGVKFLRILNIKQN